MTKKILTLILLLAALPSLAQSDWFAWDDMACSGSRKVESNHRIVLKTRGGAGWYWEQTVDLTPYGSICIEFSQPTTRDLTFSVIYDDAKVSRSTIKSGTSTFDFTILPAHTRAYAAAITSMEGTATVYFSRAFLKDKSGQEVTSVARPMADSPQNNDTQWFNAAGLPLDGPQPGLNIVRKKLQNGQTVVNKIIIH